MSRGVLGEDVDRVARRRRQLVGKLQDIAKAEKQRQLLAEQSKVANALIQTRQGPDAGLELGVDILKCRVAEEEARREAWRLAGREEKYLQAYFDVEALKLQLDDLRRRHAGDPLARGPTASDERRLALQRQPEIVECATSPNAR